MKIEKEVMNDVWIYRQAVVKRDAADKNPKKR